jgi:class 3 adenylate cyclase
MATVSASDRCEARRLSSSRQLSATGDGVLCTEATRAALQRGDAGLRPRGERVLRGKPEPTPLYAVD